ncbi:MAG TPA: serine hydrolase domain-containing protein [Nocardioides sp.]|nr:serine hydrolase domain-containing protein [Nocardioides sp.]
MSDLLPGTARALEVDLAAAQSKGRLPSVVAGVVRDGELVWTGTRGRTVRRGEDARADLDTQYKIGSVTKTMTAALVMLARERGELALEDPAGRFVPQLPFPDASLRSLLAHTAGLSAEPRGPWWERSAGPDAAGFVAAHDGANRVLEPGALFHYSNLGYGVLGQVIEAVTGQSWRDALQEQLLDPLGMTRTTYQLDPPHAEGFSVHHLTGELTLEPLPDTGAMAPAGQLWSTVPDQARWLTALVDPDRSVLSAESLRAMRTPQGGLPDTEGAGTSYGLGLQILAGRGRSLVGHGGSMPGFVCGVWVDPASLVGAVVLTNGGYGLADLASRTVHTVLDAEPPLAPEWQPASEVPADLVELVGLWYWGHAPSLLRVEGDGFVLTPVDSPGRTLRFVRGEGDTFVGTRGYLEAETLRVVRRADGVVSHLECATFVYTRTPYDPEAPIPGGVPG